MIDSNFDEKRDPQNTFSYKDLSVYLRLRTKNRKNIFSDYYESNHWSNSESVSGDGSTLEYTANLRKQLPALVEEFKISSVLDAPCGDYNWFRTIPRPTTNYIGGDIVPSLVSTNNARYGNHDTSFIQIDIIHDPLPSADLFICRDGLFHFSNADVMDTFRNFVKSDIKYILTTSHTDNTVNADIYTGDFRLLNLRLKPFNFTDPILVIDDWIEGYPPRQMCLWDRQTIASFVK